MIHVLTSITGGKDILVEQPDYKLKFTAFTDKVVSSKTWEIKPVYNRFKSDRRNSRIHKILTHQYTNAEYSLWIDGNMQLISDPNTYFEKLLDGYDIALFKHGDRDCLYDEARVCAVGGLDDPEVIIEQVKGYEDKGFPKHLGLGSCGFLLRRNNKKVEEFNNAWWSEYTRHSARDQISFMYAVNKTGVKVNLLKVPYFANKDNTVAMRGDYFQMVPHLTPREEI